MSPLAQRVGTALVLAPLGVAAVLFLPTAAFALLMGVLCALALHEWSRMVLPGGRPKLAAGDLAYVAANLALMALVWSRRDTELLRWTIGAGVAWWLFVLLWLANFEFGRRGGAATRALKLLGGTLAVVPAWAAILWLHEGADHGRWWVLFVMVLVWCADVFAFFAGRRYGKRKLAPRISPGKTIAGLVGALVGSAAYAAVAGWFLVDAPRALPALVALAVATVLASVVGDLFESLVKRHAEVKDSGTLFPGHGGMFDRLDSLFAAIPVFVAGLAWLAP